jgi:GT2 family glycosyltransferase
MVSVLSITLDHFDLAKKCLGLSLIRAGTEYEFLSADNGSNDSRVIEYVESLKPAYHRVNGFNEGVAGAHNQLLLRSKGDWICILDPDFQLPNGWLAALLDYGQAIPETGVASIYWGLELFPLQQVNGRSVHVGMKVYGVKFFSRKLIEQIGGFCEDYHPYAFEDADFNFRARNTGHINYYIPNMIASHCGNDVGEKSAYRQSKWDSLTKSAPIYNANISRYAETGNYFVPLPPMK